MATGLHRYSDIGFDPRIESPGLPSNAAISAAVRWLAGGDGKPLPHSQEHGPQGPRDIDCAAARVRQIRAGSRRHGLFCPFFLGATNMTSARSRFSVKRFFRNRGRAISPSTFGLAATFIFSGWRPGGRLHPGAWLQDPYQQCPGCRVAGDWPGAGDRRDQLDGRRGAKTTSRPWFAANMGDNAFDSTTYTLKNFNLDMVAQDRLRRGRNRSESDAPAGRRRQSHAGRRQFLGGEFRYRLGRGRHGGGRDRIDGQRNGAASWTI